MNWNDDRLAILGLARAERSILSSIPTAQIVRDIASETGISRTGVNHRLRGLIRKGYVRVLRDNRKKLYVSIGPEEMDDKLQAASLLFRKGEAKGVRIRDRERGEFIFHVGSAEIIPAYERIAAKNKNERIRAIQHHRSWKELVKRVPPEQLIEFNRSIVKNRLIIDGVLNESAYSDYREEVKKYPAAQKRLVESLGDRMADYTVFPDACFNYDAEIWIFKNTTLIINWRQEIATEIKNANITGILRDMFDLMKAQGSKIDHNQLIGEIRKLTVPNPD